MKSKKFLIITIIIVSLYSGCTSTNQSLTCTTTPKNIIDEQSSTQTVDDSIKETSIPIHTPTLTITPNLFSPTELATNADEEKQILEEMVQTFLEVSGLDSLDAISEASEGVDGFYGKVMYVINPEDCECIHLLNDVYLIGSYWIDTSVYYQNEAEETVDELQVVVFYSPVYHLIVKGILSVTYDDKWIVIPTIVNDNFREYGGDEGFEITLSFNTKSEMDQWISNHVGEAFLISELAFYQNVPAMGKDPNFPDFFQPFITDEKGVINRYTHVNPEITQSILSYVFYENPENINRKIIITGLTPKNRIPGLVK